MIHFTTKFSYCWLACLAVLAITHSISAQAAPGTLSQIPLFTSDNRVQPNVFLTLDNSGSMDSEIVTKKYWNLCAYDRDALDSPNNSGDCGSIRSDSYFFGYLGTTITNSKGTPVNTKTYGYIYQNADDVYYTTSCPGNEGEASFACIDSKFTAEVQKTALEYDWRVRSSALNTLYYNPNIQYEPWQTGNGSKEQASFTAARSDPELGKAGYTLTKDLKGFVFEVWEDSHGFDASKPRTINDRDPVTNKIIGSHTELAPRRGTNINRTTGGNGWVDVWDNHTRYTVNADSITKESFIYEPTLSGSGSTTPPKGTLNSKIISTETLTHGVIKIPDTKAPNGSRDRTLEEEKQNIANWYQYYRRRAFATKAAVAAAVSQNPDFHYGLTVTHTPTTLFVEVPPKSVSDYKPYNAALLTQLFDYIWLPRSTPLQAGLDAVGKYFSHLSIDPKGKASLIKTDPVSSKCQKNYAILFTDGYWNGDFNAFGDQDKDGYPDTVADVAKYYYDNKGLVTYTIAFGLEGKLVAGSDGWPTKDRKDNTPVVGNSDWGNPGGSKDIPEKLDDLWHAAYNTGGSFLSASSPEAVTKGFADILANIESLSGGSASSVSFNTSTLTSTSSIYSATFVSPSKSATENPDWIGDLESFSLSSTGDIAGRQWSAASKLTTAIGRNIFTYNREINKGIPFQWDNLATNQQNDLLTNTDNSIGTNISIGQSRLAYLRGSQAEEGIGDSKFRKRSRLLADIVHSDPLFVGKPQSFWPSVAPFTTNCSQTYSTFKTANTNRAKVVYVGTNDGMLHGFSASNSAGSGYGDGSEVMAYIPNSLFSSGRAITGLHYLTDQNYTHRYYVDLPTTVEDVCIDTTNLSGNGLSKSWHSVLLGGLMAGGRGIFALDVTNPSSANFTESNANKVVLWEFDNTDDPDMGYSFSKPTIALMENGRWAAIFGNGYNATGKESTGNAALFILFLDGGLDGVWTKGTDYIKIAAPTTSDKVVGSDCINSGSNCNGLATPQLVDIITRNYQMDRAYAGDLRGNLWAFNLSSKDPKDWKVAYNSTSGIPQPLFTASHHITPPTPTTKPEQKNLCAGAPCIQQITSKPLVDINPSVKVGPADPPNVLVFFGTGQYLTDGDLTTTNVQSFYGVWDHGVSNLTPANLVEQTFLGDKFYGMEVTTPTDTNYNADVRILSNYAVTYDNNNKTTEQGWFINLSLASGERVVVDPDLYKVKTSNTENIDLIFFNTWIPTATECTSGGSGFEFSVNMTNGGNPVGAVFDLNKDGVVNIDDRVFGTTKSARGVAAIAFKKGLPSSSTIFNSTRYTSGTNPGAEANSNSNTPGSSTSGSNTSGSNTSGSNNNGKSVPPGQPADPNKPPVTGTAVPKGKVLNRISWQELRNN